MNVASRVKLPEEAHSSSSYILLDRNGVFKQHREYNANHKVVFEIGYHNEPSLGKVLLTFRNPSCYDKGRKMFLKLKNKVEHKLSMKF